MKSIDNFTAANMEIATPILSKERIEVALNASYEIESLMARFPEFLAGNDIELADEYLQKLIIHRVSELSRAVMSALDDDKEIFELRNIVRISGQYN